MKFSEYPYSRPDVAALKREQIYVRYFDQPRLDNSLRITIGTDGEMEALYAFLENYLKTV